MGTATFVVLSVLLVTSILGTLTLGTAGQSYATYPGENGRIAFVQNGNIFTMDPDGSEVRLIMHDVPMASAPAWSPDSTKIAFTSSADNNRQIFVVNADGTGLTQLTDSAIDKLYPTWSPDGTKIAFDSHGRIYVMNADGTDETQLPMMIDSTTWPNWSPDGTKMALIDDGVVAVMNADGTGLTDITDCSVCDASYPNWSPDGTKIAFAGGFQTTYVVNPDGTGLTALKENASSPAWSPDGTKIVFANEDGIQVMNSDGTNSVNLGVIGGEPDWGSSMVVPPLSDDTPVVTGTVDRAPDSNGYYNHEIIITWSGTDSDGIASCDPEISYVGPDSPPASGGDNSITFTGHCTDNLGNEGTGTVSIRYDDTEPDISSPQQDGTFFVGQDVPTDFSCTDDSSGIQSCEASADTIDTSSAGSRSYVVTATDVAGNTEQLTVDYTVFTEESYTLTINAAPSAEGSALHMWTVIRSNDGTVVQSGFTPLTFVGDAGSRYIVTVSDYQGITFSNWDNGSSSRHRAFTLSSDVNATAFYDTSSVLRGFTSLTYTGTAEQPDLTVDAVSLTDSRTLHMWTSIQLVSSDESGAVYKVTVQDYLDRQFNHWEDGSTDRTRTMTLEEAATITAYYNTD